MANRFYSFYLTETWKYWQELSFKNPILNTFIVKFKIVRVKCFKVVANDLAFCSSQKHSLVRVKNTDKILKKAMKSAICLKIDILSWLWNVVFC